VGTHQGQEKQEDVAGTHSGKQSSRAGTFHRTGSRPAEILIDHDHAPKATFAELFHNQAVGMKAADHNIHPVAAPYLSPRI